VRDDHLADDLSGTGAEVYETSMRFIGTPRTTSAVIRVLKKNVARKISVTFGASSSRARRSAAA
jgi:hypothetical protein